MSEPRTNPPSPLARRRPSPSKIVVPLLVMAGTIALAGVAAYALYPAPQATVHSAHSTSVTVCTHNGQPCPSGGSGSSSSAVALSELRGLAG